MSTQGPGNGVELVNKMRPKGELGGCWVFFDFVKRMHDWTTMACHVYNPFVREMQTIAIGDFKVEDTESQILFWTLLNMVMEKEGYKKACFKGFMGLMRLRLIGEQLGQFLMEALKMSWLEERGLAPFIGSKACSIMQKNTFPLIVKRSSSHDVVHGKQHHRRRLLNRNWKIFGHGCKKIMLTKPISQLCKHGYMVACKSSSLG